MPWKPSATRASRSMFVTPSATGVRRPRFRALRGIGTLPAAGGRGNCVKARSASEESYDSSLALRALTKVFRRSGLGGDLAGLNGPGPPLGEHLRPLLGVLHEGTDAGGVVVPAVRLQHLAELAVAAADAAQVVNVAGPRLLQRRARLVAGDD